MLQRAASNAYSWWWASHIRTKQTKWLEQSRHDMEEKIQTMLKLIQEDGDSFAKRAEMYYKKRPELINSVEEAHKAFRSLADRYDHLSKELQAANHTIATVFPEQVPYMEDEEESPAPKIPRNIPVEGNIPKVPKAPNKDLKRIITTASKQLKEKKASKVRDVVKSGLTKEEAFEEIDKIQKDILALQTVKEFVKSSYESGIAKYWGIENQITEMQQKVCRLQDEFNVDTVIEDDEARTLMAEAALKSCEEILTQLQEKQEKSEKEAKEEFNKIEFARLLLESLREKYLHNGEPPSEEDKKAIEEQAKEIEHLQEISIENSDSNAVGSLTEEIKHLREKMNENLDPNSTGSLTVTQLAERIDQLVDKVINLESAMSSQTVLINTLKTEADDLHAQTKDLEDEKESLVNNTHNLNSRVKEMEEKLTKIQDLNKNVERQSSYLQTDFAEARYSLDHLSEKVSTVKPDEVTIVDVKEVDMNVKKSVTFLDQKLNEDVCATEHVNEEEKVKGNADLSWQMMLLSTVDDREKILLKEYTDILKNYKDVKKKLGDMEKKDRDSQFDIIMKMRDQKKAISKRDEEIQNLRERLNLNIQDEEDRSLTPEMETHEVEPVEPYETSFDIPITIIEEKFQKDIDAMLDENLDFWLRFSSVFHQIKKFKTEVQDLQNEIVNLEENKKMSEMKSEVRPIYKHLREIQAGLTVWLEQSVPMKDELKRRFISLCGIQEDITKTMKEGVEDEGQESGLISGHQAAILQGAILSMKQENNKVREELQAGFDHVSILQLEIEKTLRKLNEDFGVSSDQPELKHAMSRSKIPLRSFIFGMKVRGHSLKGKSSIFSRYQILRAAIPPKHNIH